MKAWVRIYTLALMKCFAAFKRQEDVLIQHSQTSVEKGVIIPFVDRHSTMLRTSSGITDDF